MDYKKNSSLDDKIRELNNLLAPIERELAQSTSKSETPNLLMVGASRTGSTLFMQWVVQLGVFGYPSNFLSRFPKAPYIGALIYEIVTNPQYQYLNEFSDINRNLGFKSSIGKTEGFKAPHEFWYFWRRLMNFPEIPFSEEKFAESFNFNLLNKELDLLQRAFGKPYICKAKIINWYLKSMAENVPNVIFLHLYRDPIDVIRSTLKIRKDWMGSEEKWGSWKPREYDDLIKMDKYHQVAGQFYFTEKEILSKKKYLGDSYHSFSYKEFCNNPKIVYDRIFEKIHLFNPSFKKTKYTGEKRFRPVQKHSMNDSKIEEAWMYFVKEYGKLNY